MANYTILLIDYEPRSIERFRDPLIAAGFAVEIATDGVSGIEAFHRLNPDMVLVEAMIPKKHGFEVCQELKRTPHGRRTPVIITTGVYKGRKYRTQALHIYGCDEYIEKPIAPEQLLEVVGKFFGPGSSGPLARGTETDRTTPDPSGGTSPRSKVDAVAKPTPVVAKDDTEDEIMARLDAIMPGGGTKGGSAPVSAAPKRTAIVASVDDQDPFAQMRAELDAELGALPEPFVFETAPKLEPIPESIPEVIPAPYPSDQVVAPSVLEALPVPEVEIPMLQPQVPAPTAQIETPGQIVSFDTKRNRKNKKAEKQKAARTQQAIPIAPVEAIAPPPQVLAPPPQTIAPAAHAIAPEREAISPPGIAPRAAAAEVTLPRGTIVESELESSSTRRGKPIWIWAAVGAVAIAALFFVFRPGVSDRPTVASNPVPAPAVAPPQASSPAANVPVEAPPTVPEPSASVAETPAPAVAATKLPPPKKSSDRPPTVAATTAPTPTAAASKKPAGAVPSPQPVAPPKNTAPATPAPVAPPPAPVVAAKVAPPPTAPAPADLDNTVAEVEAVADPAAAPSTATIKPGALIPIDVADTMPVAVSHQAPVFSLEAKQLHLSGTVIMNVLVNDRGTVDQVVLVTGVPGADVNDAAMRAAKSWTYRPATKEGVPVKVWKSEQVAFKL